MQAALKLTARVLPGKRSEFTAPELTEGEDVELIVLQSDKSVPPSAQPFSTLTFRLNARFQNVHHGRFEIRFSTSNEMLWIYGDLGIACLLYQSVINS